MICHYIIRKKKKNPTKLRLLTMHESDSLIIKLHGAYSFVKITAA